MTRTRSQKQRAAAIRAARGIKTKQVVIVQRPKQKQRPSKARRQRRMLNSGLSTCAAKYLKVLADPFSGALACVPSIFNYPSMKHSVRVQGTFATGTVGIGFVMANPWEMCFASGGPSVQQPVEYSTSTFAGNAFTNWTASNGVATSNSNTPYASSLVNNAVEYRVVGSGLRIRNVTPVLNRGGTCVGGESLNHTDLVGFGIDSFMLMDTTERVDSSSQKWQSVTWHPSDPYETDFQPSATIINDSRYNCNVLGFIVQAPSATPQTYEFEVYTVFEAKGTAVHGLSKSDSDPVGFATVQNLMSSAEARKPITYDTAAWASNLIGKAAGLAGAAYAGYRSVSGPNGRRQIGPIITEID